MATIFDEPVMFLDKLGIFDVILPFVLVFCIVYAVLDKTRVLGTVKGKPNKRLNSMVAFVMGFIFIAFSNYVGGLFTAIPIIIFVLLIGIFLAIVLGGVGIDVKDYWLLGLLAVVAAGWIAASAFGLFDSSYWQSISAFIPWDFVIGVVVFILVMWLLLREKKEEAPVREPAEQPTPTERRPAPQPARQPPREPPPQQQEITPEMREDLRRIAEQIRQTTSPEEFEQALQQVRPEFRDTLMEMLR